MLAVEEEQDEGGQGETEEIEEEWGDVGEGGFDEGEGCSPEEGRGDQEDVSEGLGADLWAPWARTITDVTVGRCSMDPLIARTR